MSESKGFRVSLHLSHPSRPAEEISAAFSRPLRYSRSAGEPRTTKGGRRMDGCFCRTDVSIAITDGVLPYEEIGIGEYLASALDALPMAAVHDVVTSGGACSFLIGVYSEESVLCDFDAKLVAKLAAAGIGLKVDFYGGPGP